MKCALAEIDDALSRGDTLAAEKLCVRLISRLRQDCDEALKAREKLAQIKLRSGDYTQAFRMLDELKAIATEVGNRALEGRCYLNLGTAHLRKGDYQISEEYYKAACHVFKWDVKDEKWLARGYANLGILLKARGAWGQALEDLEQAAEISSKAADEDDSCVINLASCILMRKLGRIERAWDVCVEGRRTADGIGHPCTCAYFLESSNICLLRHHVEMAKDYLRRGIHLALKRGYRREQVIGTEIEGDIAYEEGDMQEAGRAYREALDLALELAKRSDLIPEIRRRIALVELDSGHTEEAYKQAKQAVAVAREIDDKWELGVSLRVMGQVHLTDNEIGLAAEALEESIAVLAGLSSENYELGISEELLGRNLLKRGNVGDVIGSRDHLLKARQIFGYLGWAGHVTEVDRLLGRIEKDHGLFVVGVGYQGMDKTEEVVGKHGVDTARYGLITCDERIVGDIARWGGTEVRVLIEGETGVGKELVARALHALGRRRENRFVAVDCGALSETLADSELFGHVKGSFTGAHRDRVGLIEEADGGTLLLDEVGELSESLQTKLLRVLEEGKVRWVGENKARPVDMRLISATTRDLWVAVEEGSFRRDLYYRLKGVLIRVPALRERRGDIELLLDHFLKLQCEEQGKRVRLSHEAMRKLLAYEWPGNVRELKSVVEALVAASGDGARIDGEAVEGFLVNSGSKSDLRGRLEEVERAEIEKALSVCGGNKSKAAKMLGISRKTLYYRLSDR